ncbi:MAG: EAL domain-containing protein [Rhodoferax sp.]|nr:EAL domain-containing protein [Rhodoferax sp.]
MPLAWSCHFGENRRIGLTRIFGQGADHYRNSSMMTEPSTSRHRAPGDWDAPVNWGPSKTFIHLTLAAMLTGAALVAVVLLVLAPQNHERLLGPGLVATVGLLGWWLAATDRIVAARWFLAGGIWVTFTLVAMFTGGVRAPVVFAFPIFIVMCGWQLSARAALIATGATVIVVAALTLAETRGLLAEAPLYLPVMHGSVLAIVLLLAGAMIALLVGAYRKKIGQLQQSREDLRRHSEDLESSRAALQRAQAVASVGSWAFDLTSNRIQLSTETCRIVGIPDGTEGDFDAFLTRVHEGDRAVYAEAWAAALRGASFDHEHRIVVGQQVRWIRQKAEFERGIDGAPLRALGVTQDITERKQADERIAELAFHDQLSGLPNRTLLRDRLKQAVTVSERDQGFNALLFLDLDNFKSLNDTLGHDVGDLLLQQVANRLMGCVRGGDTVARLGGDEFVLMLAGLGRNEAAAVMAAEAVGEKVLAALSVPYQIRSHEHSSTCSIGVTLFGGGQSESIEEPLKRADLAMYQAKAIGRNALRFFDPDMQAAVSDRVALDKDLRAALAREEFSLNFQPILNAVGGVVGAEALLRWQHPVRGMVSPAEFISAAEETGLILPLGHWVLCRASEQLTSWSTQPQLAGLTIAVNVSARQFRQPDFAEQVLDALAQAGANPRQLKLELTESLLVSNFEDVIARMSTLRAHGVGFALDDFGTGYSSLAYLGRLPLDQLKIDRSFVMNIESDPHAVAICSATISLAHSLGLKVVAEGVETLAQREKLCMVLGCDYFQGFLFSRPLPIEQFEAFALQHGRLPTITPETAAPVRIL